MHLLYTMFHICVQRENGRIRERNPHTYMVYLSRGIKNTTQTHMHVVLAANLGMHRIPTHARSVALPDAHKQTFTTNLLAPSAKSENKHGSHTPVAKEQQCSLDQSTLKCRESQGRRGEASGQDLSITI